EPPHVARPRSSRQNPACAPSSVGSPGLGVRHDSGFRLPFKKSSCPDGAVSDELRRLPPSEKLLYPLPPRLAVNHVQIQIAGMIGHASYNRSAGYDAQRLATVHDIVNRLTQRRIVARRQLRPTPWTEGDPITHPDDLPIPSSA